MHSAGRLRIAVHGYRTALRSCCQFGRSAAAAVMRARRAFVNYLQAMVRCAGNPARDIETHGLESPCQKIACYLRQSRGSNVYAAKTFHRPAQHPLAVVGGEETQPIANQRVELGVGVAVLHLMQASLAHMSRCARKRPCNRWIIGRIRVRRLLQRVKRDFHDKCGNHASRHSAATSASRISPSAPTRRSDHYHARAGSVRTIFSHRQGGGVDERTSRDPGHRPTTWPPCRAIRSTKPRSLQEDGCGTRGRPREFTHAVLRLGSFSSTSRPRRRREPADRVSR